MNDLISIVNHSQITVYVDDCQLYLKFSISDLENATASLNNDLQIVCNCCAKNSLLINPDKTKLIIVATTQLTKRLPDLTLSLLGKTIRPISGAKNLGVFIDNGLNYNTHIIKTSSSCINQLLHINRIKHLLDKTTLKLLINSFVFSRLFYCSFIWQE